MIRSVAGLRADSIAAALGCEVLDSNRARIAISASADSEVSRAAASSANWSFSAGVCLKKFQGHRAQAITADLTASARVDARAGAALTSHGKKGRGIARGYSEGLRPDVSPQSDRRVISCSCIP